MLQMVSLYGDDWWQLFVARLCDISDLHLIDLGPIWYMILHQSGYNRLSRTVRKRGLVDCWSLKTQDIYGSKIYVPCTVDIKNRMWMPALHDTTSSSWELCEPTPVKHNYSYSDRRIQAREHIESFNVTFSGISFFCQNFTTSILYFALRSQISLFTKLCILVNNKC